MALELTNRQSTVFGDAGMKISAFSFAFFLWWPAIGIGGGGVYLQPADFIIILSYPILIANLARISNTAAIVLFAHTFAIVCSFLLSFDYVMLFYYVGFCIPGVMLFYLIAKDASYRKYFLRGFMSAAIAAAILFLLQYSVGAESLDFRTNPNFGRPEQYDRGFAVFPEVSTFATHTIYALGISLVLATSVRFGRIKSWRNYVAIALFTLCLLFSRSSAVILIAPAVIAIAVLSTRKLTGKAILSLIVLSLLLALFLQYYVSNFYVDRAANSAFRSIGLRGLTMITGLSVFPNFEFFGVGLGQNQIISERVWEYASEFGFSLILIPEGVNSFVIARIFEEGYVGAFALSLSIFYLIKCSVVRVSDWTFSAFIVIAVASFLVALFVTGYRGIYMNWLWFLAPIGLLEHFRERKREFRL